MCECVYVCVFYFVWSLRRHETANENSQGSDKRKNKNHSNTNKTRDMIFDHEETKRKRFNPFMTENRCGDCRDFIFTGKRKRYLSPSLKLIKSLLNNDREVSELLWEWEYLFWTPRTVPSKREWMDKATRRRMGVRSEPC